MPGPEGVPGPVGCLVPGGGLLLRAVRILLECILVFFENLAPELVGLSCSTSTLLFSTVSNTCTDLGSVTSLDMDMESSMARLQSRRDWGLFLNRYTPDLSRYTPELFLEIEDLEELENTDHWSEDSEEAERY